MAAAASIAAQDLTTPLVNSGNHHSGSKQDFEAYEDYYQRQWALGAACDDGLHVALKTINEFNQFVQKLERLGDMTRHEIGLKLSACVDEKATDQARENTVNLALSLRCMLKFSLLKGEVLPGTHVQWGQGPLSACIYKHFQDDALLDTQGTKLPKTFDAWSLEVIGGIQIDFTDNLADHLLLVEDDESMKVLIFHHVSFFRHHDRQVPSDSWRWRHEHPAYTT
ncbi:hypothetical protein CDEST_02327 [Colletotrichum destructivum]|uniref:Uncharacterized protein n=1 Tax=Colletotrichum destructivum TaxID=34406 RepID=A0AAX4I1S3_9PEZI|nr:hypothetical protein CDEST_02327 [Colletotrichum destructivum]